MEYNLIWNHAETEAPVFIFAHGAGLGMDSDYMEIMASLLCERNITVVRFEFPYMQERRRTGKKRPPDRQAILTNRWLEVISHIKSMSATKLFIGGKSMGGRMATLLAGEPSEKTVFSGVVCFGYPFYATGKKDKPRVKHLASVTVPHLFVQGERDNMGNKDTVSTYVLSKDIAICWLADGNHNLKPRKSSGLTHKGHLNKTADIASSFIRSV